MGRRSVYSALVVVIISVFLWREGCAALDGNNDLEGLNRELLQASKPKAVEITKKNAKKFTKLVEGAKDGAVFKLSLPKIEIDGPVLINASITIEGVQPDTWTEIKCVDPTARLDVRADVELKNLLLRDCSGPAVRIFNGALDENFCYDSVDVSAIPQINVVINNTRFVNNRNDVFGGFDCTPGGGAIGIASGSITTIEKCVFESNFADQGSAILVQGGSQVEVTDSIFQKNEATNAGTIFAGRSQIDGLNATSTLTIRRCRFDGNENLEGAIDKGGLQLTGGSTLETSEFLSFDIPFPSGGGVFASGLDKVLIVNSTFENNVGVPAGGALFLEDNKITEVLGSSFLRNRVEAPAGEENTAELELGGAVYVAFVNADSELEIGDCDFEGNTAAYGGAINLVTPLTNEPEISKSRFKNNVARKGGGAAVFRNTIKVRIVGMKASGNRAEAGGALFITNGAGAVFQPEPKEGYTSSFSENLAVDGGAMYTFGAGFVEIRSAVNLAVNFTGNKALRHGGAIAAVKSLANGVINLQDSVFKRNTAQKGGALYVDSLADVTMAEASTKSLREANKFVNNTAVSGGAVYLMPANQVRNFYELSSVVFEGNQAVEEVPEFELDLGKGVKPMGLGTVVGGSGRRLFQEDMSNTEEASENFLLDAKGVDPCNPAGGGAICVVLTQPPETALVQISMLDLVFKGNKAKTGGAVVAATNGDMEWNKSCKQAPCRAFKIAGGEFTNNEAVGAGGAIFASNPEDIYFSEIRDVRADSLRPLVELGDSTILKGNSFAAGGFGKDIASTARELVLAKPMPDEFGYIKRNHLSGTELPEILLQVVDAFGQIASTAVSDSILKVSVRSSAVSGQRVSSATRGIVKFSALTVTEDPGDYTLTFIAEDLPPLTARYSLRSCLMGEFNVTESMICTKCPTNFYGLDPLVPCQQCDFNANCTGGPVSFPVEGFWHSTPFSPQYHECLVEQACSYDGRNAALFKFFNETKNLTASDTAENNIDYPQCNEGYEGVVCGSCSDDYGHVGGGECIKCKSVSTTAGLISLVTLWTLTLLLFTIRSALSSIRDINAMNTIVLAQTRSGSLSGSFSLRPDLNASDSSGNSADNAPTAEAGNTRGGMRNTGDSSNRVRFTEEPLGGLGSGKSMIGLGGVTGKAVRSGELRSATMPARPDVVRPGQVPGGALPVQTVDRVSDKPARPHRPRIQTIDHIVAAESLSETVKIAANFLQVTSVAVNINADWTQSIAKMLAVQDVLAGFSSGSSLVAFDCLLQGTSGNRSILALVLRVFFPMMLLVILVLFFSFIWMIANKRASVPISVLRSRSIIAVLVVLFFAYEQITQDLMRTLNCITVDEPVPLIPDPRKRYFEFSAGFGRYWAEDTSLKCYEGSHARLVGILGIPGVVGFAIGIPLLLFVFLIWNKEKDRLIDQEFLNTYGFVYQNYQLKFVYWEVSIMVRKALIGCIVVFAYPLGSNLQGVLCQGVLVLALILHLIAAPYKYKTLNLLEGASLVVSIFTFYSGIVFNDGKTSPTAQVLLSVVLLTVNIGLLALFLYRGYHELDKFIIAKLKMEGVTNIPSTFAFRLMRLLDVKVRAGVGVVAKKGRVLVRSHATRNSTYRHPPKWLACCCAIGRSDSGGTQRQGGDNV